MYAREYGFCRVPSSNTYRTQKKAGITEQRESIVDQDTMSVGQQPRSAFSIRKAKKKKKNNLIGQKKKKEQRRDGDG